MDISIRNIDIDLGEKLDFPSGNVSDIDRDLDLIFVPSAVRNLQHCILE